MTTKQKTKYADLPEIIKINKQWRKLSGLHSREEWSAAAVRAATAAELAATLAIREEFRNRTKFKPSVTDSFLIWANGLDGKVTKLIFPLFAHRKKDLETAHRLFKILKGAGVNKHRNMIVHGGHFCTKLEASKIIAASRLFVEGLVNIYYDDFSLPDPKLTLKRTVDSKR